MSISALLDSDVGRARVADERFDALSRLAHRHFKVATALIVEHEGERLKLRSCIGEASSRVPARSTTGSLHVVEPIMSAEGKRLGDFILLDGRFRELTDEEHALLADLAHLAGIAVEGDHARAVLRDEVAAMRESELRMALAINNSGTGIWDRNVATDEIHYSAGWKAILGYGEDEIGTSIDESYHRLHPDDLPYVQASIQAHFQQITPSYEVEHRIQCKDGRYKWIASRGKVISRDANGQPLRMVGTTTDITERKQMEAELKTLATIDFLTQLPNRRHFMHQLDAELGRARRNETHTTSVLMCDLDHFKSINDRFGHAFGDLALRHFANLLSSQLRVSDSAGRLGGEEFAVLLPDTNTKDATAFAQRLQSELAKAPLTFDGDNLPLTVSIGISALGRGDDSPDAVLSRSDKALYLAKENGRNRVEFA